MPNQINAENYPKLMHQYLQANHPIITIGLKYLIDCGTHNLKYQVINQFERHTYINNARLMIEVHWDELQRYLDEDQQLIFHDKAMQTLDRTPYQKLADLIKNDDLADPVVHKHLLKAQTKLKTQWYNTPSQKIIIPTDQLSIAPLNRTIQTVINDLAKLEYQYLKAFDQSQK